MGQQCVQYCSRQMVFVLLTQMTTDLGVNTDGQKCRYSNRVLEKSQTCFCNIPGTDCLVKWVMRLQSHHYNSVNDCLKKSHINAFLRKQLS